MSNTDTATWAKRYIELLNEVDALRERLSLYEKGAVPCQRCGGNAPEFVVSNEAWNLIVRDGGKERAGEYICVRCFGEIAREKLLAAVAGKNGSYDERNRLVSLLAALYPSCLERHSDADKEWEDDWRWIVFIDLPTGQASWHIHDSQLSLFDGIPRLRGWMWDGHTTEEKYRHIEHAVRSYTRRPQAEPQPEKGERPMSDRELAGMLFDTEPGKLESHQFRCGCSPPWPCAEIFTHLCDVCCRRSSDPIHLR